MNTKFQIQIKTSNWEGGSPTITKEISLNDVNRFSDLVKFINNNSGGQHWNWFKRLPETWDGHHYILDIWNLCKHMDKNFGYKVEDVNLIKEFYLRFTPHGCDGIEYIKIFKIEEIEI